MTDPPSFADVLAQLRAEGVREVRAAYSGSNDEGEIESIGLVLADRTGRMLAFTDPRYEVLEETLEARLEEGWERGAGGAGRITLDVRTGRAKDEYERGWDPAW